jgi:hypothetical protein
LITSDFAVTVTSPGEREKTQFEKDMEELSKPRPFQSLFNSLSGPVATPLPELPSIELPSIDTTISDRVQATTARVKQIMEVEKQTITVPTEALKHLVEEVDMTLGEKIDKTADVVEVYSKTVSSFVEQGAHLTSALIGQSSSTLKSAVPTFQPVKVPEPVKTGIKFSANVTNQGVEMINHEKRALSDLVAKTVTSSVTVDFEEEEISDDELEESTERRSAWKATKKLVKTGGRAAHEVLGSIEGGIGVVKVKAEEEVLDIIKDSLGEEASEIAKETFALGSNILSLKGSLSPKAVGKSFAKEVSRGVVRGLHEENQPRLTEPNKE